MFAIEGFYLYVKNNADAAINNVQLILIGKGHLRGQVVERATAINTEFGKELILVQTEAELINVLTATKLFLSFQDYTNYPSQSLMEAMLFCNSVISIDNGETKRLVDVNNDNLLLTCKDPVALGSAIKKVLDGWQLNFRNREHIQQHFSPKLFADYLFKMHDKIVLENQ